MNYRYRRFFKFNCAAKQLTLKLLKIINTYIPLMASEKHTMLKLLNRDLSFPFFKSDDTEFIRRSNTVFVFVAHFTIEVDGSQRRTYFRSPSTYKILIRLQCLNDSSANTSSLIFRQDENGNQIAFGCAAPISCDSAAADDFLPSRAT